MSRRVSLSITITCAVLALGAGIGAGYAIEASHSSTLDSEIAEKNAQIIANETQIALLDSELSQCQSDLAEKQTECTSIQKELDSTATDLSFLQSSYNALTGYYQTAQREYENLQGKYEILQDACRSHTVEEIMDLQDQISSLQSEKSWLQAEVSRLENQLTPSPTHAIERSEVWGNPKFKSTAWQGKNFKLREKLEDIGNSYDETHTYIQGETDCNDMAVDIWNMLITENIKSVIVVGNKDMMNEAFDDCDHAWLYVFDADGMVIYMEPTTGEVIYGRLSDGSSNPKADPYREGFIYEKPSDLWEDLCPSNHNW